MGLPEGDLGLEYCRLPAHRVDDGRAEPFEAGRAVRQSPRGEELGVGVHADAERAVRKESGDEPLAESHHQNVGPPGARTAAGGPG